MASGKSREPKIFCLDWKIISSGPSITERYALLPISLSSYLCDRAIKVLVGGTASEPVGISRGTPQGAVLSPVLFNVMMADIPISEGVDLYIYADDITISCTDGWR